MVYAVAASGHEDQLLPKKVAPNDLVKIPTDRIRPILLNRAREQLCLTPKGNHEPALVFSPVCRRLLPVVVVKSSN